MRIGLLGVIFFALVVGAGCASRRDSIGESPATGQAARRDMGSSGPADPAPVGHPRRAQADPLRHPSTQPRATNVVAIVPAARPESPRVDALGLPAASVGIHAAPVPPTVADASSVKLNPSEASGPKAAAPTVIPLAPGDPAASPQLERRDRVSLEPSGAPRAAPVGKAESLRLWDRFDGQPAAIESQTRAAAQSLAAASAGPVAIWFRGRAQSIILPPDQALQRIATAEDHTIFVMPLPAGDQGQWSPLISRTTDALRAAKWLDDTGANEPRQAELAQREKLRQDSERAARENLHRAFSRIILGDDAPARPAPSARSD